MYIKNSYVSMNYQRTFEQLQQHAALSWPIELTGQDDGAAIITALLHTQNDFIAILNFPVRSVEEFITILPSANMRPNLFVKHLIVLSDFSAEKIKRSITHLQKYIPNGTLQYEWDGQVKTYQFQALLDASATTIKKKLGIEGPTLFQEYELNDHMREMIALLLIGASAIDEETAIWFAQCEISNYLGNRAKLEEYVKQRYIWVSTIAKGSTSNALGHAAQNHIVDFLIQNINLDNITFQKDGNLPGVTHYDPGSGKETNFDIVVSRLGKYVGIEVSFQVTTNSVIQRKSREASASYLQVQKAGHKMAYVIDGAGNFERHQAIRLICANSDCTVAFTPSELLVLAQFITEFLE